ncbi:Hypothetical_protein [Hexamita inflata]|uniref:Hypothetical_protein n=1 Tax=Hexamita inflata TaxID=28002 RepID=A0AA86NDW0_9EUKA|nr:Hypothetical protein HINF_LOCUS4939 [Hexamita inflata]CAI9944695.1 Hypothetical protein HINF_LOCUS32340 [Hexamita inflata]CAI9944698.1 Hypothetical protein HINF_LOCUS32343 [Hexamita inflata]
MSTQQDYEYSVSIQYNTEQASIFSTLIYMQQLISEAFDATQTPNTIPVVYSDILPMYFELQVDIYVNTTLERFTYPNNNAVFIFYCYTFNKQFQIIILLNIPTPQRLEIIPALFIADSSLFQMSKLLTFSLPLIYPLNNPVPLQVAAIKTEFTIFELMSTNETFKSPIINPKYQSENYTLIFSHKMEFKIEIQVLELFQPAVKPVTKPKFLKFVQKVVREYFNASKLIQFSYADYLILSRPSV